MPRLTKIYTRTGDDGTTGLGTGARVAKTSLRIEAYGLVDQLNSHIGVAIAAGPVAAIAAPLRRIQNELFHLGADLCVPEADKAKMPVPRIEQRHIDALEALLDELTAQMPPLDNFILPGGTWAAAEIHVARTVCRAAERAALRLRDEEAIGAQVVPYLNRLSDALFVMARIQNQASGVADPIWDSRA